jgi:hypothetical protein
MLATHFALDQLLEMSLQRQLPALLSICMICPLLFFRHSRALWMALDLAFSPPGPEDFVPPEDAEANRSEL